MSDTDRFEKEMGHLCEMMRITKRISPKNTSIVEDIVRRGEILFCDEINKALVELNTKYGKSQVDRSDDNEDV